MADLETIVQRMIDAGEPEENIKLVIEELTGKLNDPVQETASVGSENLSSTDSKSESISLESQQKELDDLQAKFDALSPIDNSQEAILIRRKLKKLKQDQTVKLDEVTVATDTEITANNKKI